MSARALREWRISTIIGWAFVFLMSLLSAFALAGLAPQMAPIKRGTSEQLWEQAFHFEPKGVALLGHGHIYKPREGWFLYDIQHWHGSDLYRVPGAEVEANLGDLQQKLREEKENPDIHEHALAGFEKWSNCPDITRQNADGLVDDIRDAYLQSKKDDPGIYSMVELEAWITDLRWARSKWYWASIVFEWLFLSGLVLFAAWPLLRGKGWIRWAIHFALLPLLFMLPVYLGYATYSFTSAGPSGGVLYPWLLRISHGGKCNELDREILSYTPKLLEPLSAPIGMPMVISGMGMPGPTTVVIMGLVIAVLVFAIHKLLDRFDRHILIVGRLTVAMEPSSGQTEKAN